MAIISLICKNCGGQLDPDDSLKICFCEFCGTKHIIKDEIVKNTVINNYVQSVKNVCELIADGETLLKLKHFGKAYEKFKTAVDVDPKNSRAWLGYAQASKKFSPESSLAYRAAYEFADDHEKETIVPLWVKNIRHPEFSDICKLVDDAQKEIILKKWCESVEGADSGYEELYKALYEYRDEDYAKGITLSRWTEHVRLKISRGVMFRKPLVIETNPDRSPKNISPYNHFQIELVFRFLNASEKRFIISVLSNEAKFYRNMAPNTLLEVFNSPSAHNDKSIEIKKLIKRLRDEKQDGVYNKSEKLISEKEETEQVNGTKNGAVTKNKRFWQR